MRTLIIIGIAILLAVTNPAMDEFGHFVQAQINSQAQQAGYAGAASFAAAFGLDKVAVNAIIASTDRRNYVVASVYRVDFMDQKAAFVGILGNFFPLSSN